MTVTPTDELVNLLAGHRTLGSAPRQELTWLATHGTLEHYEPDKGIPDPAGPVHQLYIVLSGHVSLAAVRGGVRHKLVEWRGGDVTGLLPYSRMTAAPGQATVEEPTDALVVPGSDLREMACECPEVTSILVHVMIDRARYFNSAMLHDEKLRSLGKLAAGLAHELNNPAAAMARFANTLPGAVAAAGSAALVLGAAGLRTDEADAVTRAVWECDSIRANAVRSPIEEAEREDAIAAWLEAHGVPATRAGEVAESPLTLEALERLAGLLRPSVLEPALLWVAANVSVRHLARETEQAATRISGLVSAVRGFTRVDETAVPQPVDLAEGLGQTLEVLRGKARGKSISLSIDVAPGTPMVRGIPAELNQVWANLLDNALDAAPQSGHVRVTARPENGTVVVRVADDGPGIPPEVRDRIFDPFFTTKDVGKGTGLGLDIVRRLLDRHDGGIEVVSEPGRTEFVVSLPPVARGAQAPDTQVPGD